MSRLTVNDPFAEVFPELFRGFLAPTRPADAPALEIRVDVKESAADYTVHAELPGVAKDDIHVEIEGNRVSISGEVKRQSEKKEGERVLRSERYYGNVARTFVLANEVDENKAEAKYDNGVLTLVLPKRAVAGGRKLTIS
ncbi:MAG TPA: Hsp20/alpha crystallin family protein [Quisquiliibacterium sp.]|nr:Hsp20/alpha crystallin family protein [Quisquiliibacterium sp.]